MGFSSLPSIKAVLCGFAACLLVGCADKGTRVHRAAAVSASAPLEHAAARLPATETGEVNESSAVRQASFVDSESAVNVETAFEGAVAVDELVRFALAANPEIQAARARAGALMARMPQARSLEDPMLSTTTFLESVETAAGPQDVILSLSQRLPWFGKRTLRADMAYHEAQAAHAALAEAELRVAEQIKLAYYDLYYLQEAINVNRSLQSRLDDVVAIARTKYETNAQGAGLESVLQAELGVAALRTTLVRLEQSRASARARLAQALGAVDRAALDVSPIFAPARLPANVDLLVGLLDQGHPQLQARRQQILRERAALTLAEQNYYPDANVGFNWIAVGSEGLSRVATGDDAYSVMVGVNLPVYRSRLDAAVREARFNMAAQARQYDAASNQIRADIETWHAGAVEHDRVLEIFDAEVLPKAQQTLDLSIEAYRLDRIGFQQLIDNYQALLRYRIEYHQRRALREQAVARLERAVGQVVAAW